MIAPGRRSEQIAIISTLVFCVGFFFLQKTMKHFMRGSSAATIEILVIGALLIGFLFVRVKYGDFHAVFSRLTRITAIGVLVYLLVEPPEFTLAYADAQNWLNYVERYYWIAVAVAAIAIFRPSFLAFPALYVMSTRFVVDEISGYRLSFLDIRYLMEMAQFLSLAACALVSYRYIARHLPPKSRLTRLTADPYRLGLCLAFAAIGLHLGNYFWSGVEKLFLGPAPWSWALENPTQDLMLMALHKGVSPSGAIPALTAWIYESFASVVPVSNVFTLLAQLLAVVVPLRLLWLRGASLAYDVFHIGIYVVGGLFFWPWIWNNVAILLAIRGERDNSIGLAPKLCCAAVVLMGFSPYLSHSARLAWFDVVDVQSPLVEVQDPTSKQWIRVPVSYWLSHSYSMSHGYHGQVNNETHYAPTVWGSVHKSDRLRTSGQCIEPPTTGAANETEADRAARVARVQAFIRAHHKKMARRGDGNLLSSFYFRSHHHPSNPWMHSDFNAINIDDVKRYRYRVTSVCLSLKDGILSENIIRDDPVVINVE